MMRQTLAGTLALTLASVTSAVQAQDFGGFLESTARQALRQQLNPERIERAIVQRTQTQEYTIKTGDGWTLVAHRYKGEGPARPGTIPVILCHGLSYNAQFWNLDEACSFASYLAGRGFDVWAVDLRGCGMSQKWVWKLDDAPSMLVGGVVRKMSRGKLAPTGYATVDPKFANYDMDHHIVYDVPALVQLVRHHTGAPEVAWVGHSMGGIVALGHLCRFQNPGIGRLVTVGSQVTMPHGAVFLQFLQEMMTTRQRQLVGQLNGKQLAEETRTSVHNMFFNEQNVSPKVYEALATWATDIPSIGLLKQYTVLSTKGELWDSRQQFCYARALNRIQVPILITAGAADQLAPAPVQQYLYQHVGSQDKSLILFGRTQGFAVDSGHNDSLVGLASQAQVYPTIENWLLGKRN